MNQSTNLGVGTASSPSIGVMSNPKILISGVVAVVGAILIGLGSSAVATNDTTVGTFRGFGILLLLAGIFGGVYFSGSFSNLNNASGNNKEYIMYIVSVVIVIGVLLAVFYNYSKSDAAPFASNLLIIALVVIAVGGLVKYAGASVMTNALVRFGFSLFFFMPYALFTFGFISDIVRHRYEYIPASFVGILGMIMNYVISQGINPSGPPSNALCEVPGLSMLSSNLAPQSMMFTLSTLAYIATNITSSKIIGGSDKLKNKQDDIWPSWVLFFAIGGSQAMVLKGIGCMDGSKLVAGVLMPFVWGSACGLIGYSVLGERDSSGVLSSTNSATSQLSSQTCGSNVAGEIYVEAVEEKFTNPDITVLRTG